MEARSFEETAVVLVAKRLGWVVLAAMLASYPAAVYVTARLDAPLWYLAVLSVTQALAIAVLAIGVGVVALIAARDKGDGGLKTGLIAAGVAGALCSLAVISTTP